MDRREFLQTITVLGAASALPALAFENNAVPVKSAAQIESAENLFQVPIAPWLPPKIGVISIGSAGGGILSAQRGNLPYLSKAIAIDTNPFALQRTNAEIKVLVGDGRTRYTEPTETRFLANAMKQDVASAMNGLDLVFILAGMGGATGTGVSPIVAEVAHDARILTIAATITPFDFEGKRRNQIAEAGHRTLSRRVNAAIPLSNQAFAQLSNDNTPIDAVLAEAPTAFARLYQSVTNSLSENGMIGIDYEDIRVVLAQNTGHAAFGFGVSSGAHSADLAIQNAINSPLLGKDRLQRATGILVSIEGKPNTLKAREIKNIMNAIRNICPEAELMFSALPNQNLVDDYSVSILANGIPIV